MRPTSRLICFIFPFLCFFFSSNYSIAQRSESTIAPTPPLNLWAVSNDGNVIVQWGPGFDSESDQSQLTYDLRVGTKPGASDIIAPSGTSEGNAGQVTEFNLGALNEGPIYWSVATVDERFERSPYATEQVFDLIDDQFQYTGSDIPGFGVWGDYDNDGDLDIFAPSDGTTILLRNDNGAFSEVQTDIPSGTLQLADYDNDNDLDVLVHANKGSGTREDEFSKIYRNDEQKFVDSGIDPGTSFFCQLESHRRLLVDVDNNGLLDLVSPFEFGGIIGGSIGVRLNKEGVFAENFELWGNTTSSGSIVPADYNSDGRIDLVSNGLDDSQCDGGLSSVNKNVGGAFEFINAGLLQGWRGAPAWGDYDADGDMDIITSGDRAGAFSFPGLTGPFSGIYQTNGDSFTLIDELLPNSSGTPVWADMDMDGDLDVILPSESPLYENRDGEFVNLVGAFDGMSVSRAAWADYDNDDDIDLLIQGTLDGKPVTRIYSNTRREKNDKPLTPGDLKASVNGASVTFIWTSPGDEETPTPGLTYNLRVGTKPGASDVMSPASLAGGIVLQPHWGNTYHNTSWTLNGLADGTYYWSVQAVDGGFMGSSFASENTVVVGEPVGGAPFSDSGQNFDGLDEGDAEWGDYDGDGDLDLMTMGTSNNGASTTLYENTGSGFSESTMNFDDLDLAALDWGDYDNDGDLDVVISGRGSGDSHNTILYTNNGSSFSANSTMIPGVLEGAVAWGDYDNDGDLDLLLTGLLSSLENIARVYENDNNTFSDIGAGLTGIRRGGVAWVDYDGDGDLDIMTTGRIDNVINRRTFLYQNEEGIFSPVSHSVPNVDLSSVDWGDYDQDGDPDLLITGTTGSEFISRVYRNDGGSFTDIGAGLPGTEFSSARWGDADNDGDLDLMLSGSTSGGRATDVYINQLGSFSALNAGFTGVSKSSVAWADYDNDDDLDVFVMGEQSDNSRSAKLYVNNSEKKNAGPEPPSEFFSNIDLETVTLNWDQGTDDETASAGLSYNLRIGTTPGGTDILAPMADANGYRHIVRQGNMQQVQSWKIRLLRAGLYYWSVQSIDSNFKGSIFGAEQSFLLLDDLLPVELTAFSGVHSEGTVVLTWETASETNNAGFDLERSLDGQVFERVAFVEGQGTAVSTTTYRYTDTQLPYNTGQLYYRLKQIDFDGQFAYSEVVNIDLGIPVQAQLWPNYPNPFNPTTKIRYELPVASEINLTVYDATGKLVQVLVDEVKEAGRYEADFDASGLASGIYFYRLSTGAETMMKQMILMK